MAHHLIGSREDWHKGTGSYCATADKANEFWPG